MSVRHALGIYAVSPATDWRLDHLRDLDCSQVALSSLALEVALVIIKDHSVCLVDCDDYKVMELSVETPGMRTAHPLPIPYLVGSALPVGRGS